MSRPAKRLPAELVENFEFLEDWTSRYAYLIELGENLPSLADEHRTENNRVKGCMSQVWIEAITAPDGRRIDFIGDCDTAIVKGILAVLIELMSGLPPDEIDSVDVEAIFEALQLKENLSPSRHFGVYAIVEMMKQKAMGLRPGALSVAS